MKRQNRLGLGTLIVGATIAMGSFGYTMLTSTVVSPSAVASSPATLMIAEAPTAPEVTQLEIGLILDELEIRPEKAQDRSRNHPKGSRHGQNGFRGR